MQPVAVVVGRKAWAGAIQVIYDKQRDLDSTPIIVFSVNFMKPTNSECDTATAIDNYRSRVDEGDKEAGSFGQYIVKLGVFDKACTCHM